jgi:hypothetical protein
VTSGGLFARNSQILALQVVDSSGPGIAYSDKCPNSDAALGTTEDGVSRHIGRHGSPRPDGERNRGSATRPCRDCFPFLPRLLRYAILAAAVGPCLAAQRRQ